MTPLSKSERDRLADVAKKVRQTVYAVCRDPKAWRMSIPPHPDDSDTLICELADSVERLLAQISDIEARLDAAETREKVLKARHERLRMVMAVIQKSLEDSGVTPILNGDA